MPGKSLPDSLTLCPELDTAAFEAVGNGSIALCRDVTPTLPSRGDLYLRLSYSPLRDAYLGTKGATIIFEDLTLHHSWEAEQERIRQIFGWVDALCVRDRLLSDPSHLSLDSLLQKTPNLFADISGFTSFSESIQPEILVKC